MATFPGCTLDPGALRYQDPSYVASSNRETWSPHGTVVSDSLASLPLRGCSTLTYGPITPLPPQAKVGCGILTFTDLYYDRIHVIPAQANLGQVLSDQSEQTEVWNAYRVPRYLQTITAQNTDGITYDSDQPGGIPPPDVEYLALQSRLYNFEISVIGPPGINATYDFQFDSETVTYHLTGQRLALFPFPADWSQPVVERLEWRTQVLRSYDDKEQTIALRTSPRRFLRANIGGFRLNKQSLNAAILQNQGLPFAVPSWQDESQLEQAASAGATVLFCDTTTRFFVEGGLAVLMHDPQTTEIVTISTVTSNTLTLQGDLENDWDSGTPIYPVRVMRLPVSQNVTNVTGNVELVLTNWEQLVPEQLPDPETPAATYMGYPVLQVMPDWAGNRQRTFQRKTGTFDPGTGPKIWDQEGEDGRAAEPFRWFLNGRDTIYWFKSWLAARKGKQSPVWLPSWGADMTLYDTITPSSVNMLIQGNWGSKFFRAEPNVYHHIRIFTKTGQEFYRKVLSISPSQTEGVDLVSFSNPDGTDSLGVTLDPQDIELISFLRLSRLDTDSVELSWQTLQFATCSTRFSKGDQPG